MTAKRVTNLRWKFPDFPPRPIKREVVFSLMKYEGALYFVNDSDEVLETVSSDSCGYVLDASIDGPKFLYKDVKPGESVKVEEYDNYYDLDYVLGFYLYIKSNSLGKIKIIPPFKKGGVAPQPLLYKDGTTPMFVSMGLV